MQLFAVFDVMMQKNGGKDDVMQKKKMVRRIHHISLVKNLGGRVRVNIIFWVG